jgi:hypothetical protein
VVLASRVKTGTLTETAATRVDCGDGPNAAKAALLVGSEVRWLDASLAEVGSETRSGARDLAVVDLGAGAEAVTCETPDCSVVSWAFADDGSGAAAWTDADGTQVERAGAEPVRVGPAGALSVDDVDRDGHPDLIVVEPSGPGVRVRVFRTTGDAWAPGEVFAVDGVEAGPAAAVGGEVAPRLWFAGADGAVRTP